jgi:hypothetical protein
MSDMIATAGTPEVALGTGTPATGSPHQVSSSWSDMEKDLAAIAAEQAPPAQPASSPAAVTPPAPQAEAAPTPAPVTPAAVTPPAPEVPEQFRGPDGKLDQEKVLKSYSDLRKEFNRRIQSPAASQAPVVPAQAQPVQAQPNAAVQVSQFELQVAQDIVNDAAALGVSVTREQAIVQARSQIRLEEARHRATTAATLSKVEQFEQKLAEENDRKQLENLARDHAWVLTPQGFKEVEAVMAEKPWMFTNQDTRYSDAVEVLLGRKAKSGQQGLVNMPTPTGAQNGAPPLPATPAPVAQAPIRLETQAEIMAHVAKLTPEQEAEFWKKVDPKLKWDIPKQFRGL